MSYGSGLNILASVESRLPYTSGLVVSGVYVAGSGITSNWNNILGASGSFDNVGTYFNTAVGTGTVVPILLFTINPAYTTTLNNKDLLGVTVRFRSYASGSSMTGVTMTGFLFGANTQYGYKCTGIATGTWTDHILGGSGDNWGLTQVTAATSNSLKLYASFNVPAGSSGAVYVDGIQTDFYHVDHQDKVVISHDFNGYLTNPQYRRQR